MEDTLSPNPPLLEPIGANMEDTLLPNSLLLEPIGVNMEDTLSPNPPLLDPAGANTEGYSSREFVDRLDMVCYYTIASPSQAEAPPRY